MSLTNILILILTALLIRIAFPGKLRKWALLVISIVAIYWLQPTLPIRNMDFWFPTATLGLAFLGWGLTAEKEQLNDRGNWLAGTSPHPHLFLFQRYFFYLSRDIHTEESKNFLEIVKVARRILKGLS